MTRHVYHPAMWLYLRMIQYAVIDATRGGRKRPSDEALLARDWIATSSGVGWRESGYLSFEHCCSVLGLDADAERVALLEQIDRSRDFDTPECWARLEALRAQEIDCPAIFATPRVVPALDQMCFAMEVRA